MPRIDRDRDAFLAIDVQNDFAPAARSPCRTAMPWSRRSTG